MAITGSMADPSWWLLPSFDLSHLGRPVGPSRGSLWCLEKVRGCMASIIRNTWHASEHQQKITMLRVFFYRDHLCISDACYAHAMPTSGMLDRLRGRVCSPIKFESLRCLNGQSTQVDFGSILFQPAKLTPVQYSISIHLPGLPVEVSLSLAFLVTCYFLIASTAKKDPEQNLLLARDPFRPLPARSNSRPSWVTA
ncbi:uncharacterized protein LY89DRAFT_82571 [Mollisia scopiformis]|uniref:Uncharacterized protein n=1 Tax=Mollisia scopiformis TaxID=149040 RepID=A0A194X887_MOLSC|nr:uncharacterized protein LY89DRAFT_82571 [Mollisia scopiformis]KUJ16383.1 hypothetical protein LY89DRAFT_82571 [Mollisia scopiformis]